SQEVSHTRDARPCAGDIGGIAGEVGRDLTGVQWGSGSYAPPAGIAAHGATLHVCQQPEDRHVAAAQKSPWARIGPVVSTARAVESVVLHPELWRSTAQCAEAVHRTTRRCLLAEARALHHQPSCALAGALRTRVVVSGATPLHVPRLQTNDRLRRL